MSLPMGLFRTCHRIMTVTMLASLAAFGLSESKGAAPSLRRDGLHVPRTYIFRSTLEPYGTYCSLRTAFLWPIYHLSLPSALQASKVGHSGETLDLPDSQIWSTAVWAHLAMEAWAHPPSANPGSRVGLGWIHHRKGEEGKRDMHPKSEAPQKGVEGEGARDWEVPEPHAWRRAGEWSTRILEGKGAWRWWILLWMW